MSTTTLVVEMVIIDFQVLIWMVMLVFTIFGFNWIDFSALKDWTSVIVLALIAIAYTLGVVFDSFIGSLVLMKEKVRPSVYWLESPEEESFRARAYLLANDLEVFELLSKMSNQISLLRSTSINLSIISVCSFIFVVTRFGFLWKTLILIAIFSVILVFLTVSTWRRSNQGFNDYATEVYSLLKHAKESPREKD